MLALLRRTVPPSCRHCPGLFVSRANHGVKRGAALRLRAGGVPTRPVLGPLQAFLKSAPVMTSRR